MPGVALGPGEENIPVGPPSPPSSPGFLSQADSWLSSALGPQAMAPLTSMANVARIMSPAGDLQDMLAGSRDIAQGVTSQSAHSFLQGLGTMAGGALGTLVPGSPDELWPMLSMFIGPKSLEAIPGGSRWSNWRDSEDFEGMTTRGIDYTTDYERELQRLNQTGIFMGPDGIRRREVPDDEAFLKMDYFQPSQSGFEDTFQGSLKDAIDHPEVLNNYPGLGEIFSALTIDSAIGPGMARGSFQPSQQMIEAQAGSPEELLSVLLHEIQHPIQYFEGMGRGGNPEEFVPLWNKANEVIRNPGKYSLSEFQEAQRILKNLGPPFRQYTNLLGEIEARDVQERMGEGIMGLVESDPMLLRLLEGNPYTRGGKAGRLGGYDVQINQAYRPYSFPSPTGMGTP